MPQPFAVTFEVTGAKAVEDRLLGIGDRAVMAEPVLLSIAGMLRQFETERFDSEGPGWAPLKPATVERKAALGQDPRILHATLALRESLTGEGSGHADTEIITNDELIFGTQVEYAIYHQRSTSKMPARPPLELNTGQRREITREIQRYLMGEEAAMLAEQRGAGNVF